MSFVQRVWEELLRTLSPLFARAKARLVMRNAQPVIMQGEARVISIMPYLARRAGAVACEHENVQIIDIRRNRNRKQPLFGKRVQRTPTAR